MPGNTPARQPLDGQDGPPLIVLQIQAAAGDQAKKLYYGPCAAGIPQGAAPDPARDQSLDPVTAPRALAVKQKGQRFPLPLAGAALGSSRLSRGFRGISSLAALTAVFHGPLDSRPRFHRRATLSLAGGDQAGKPSGGAALR